MSKNIILKIENLSKQYRLGTIGTGTLSHDLNRFLARIQGKEDPYLKIGEINDRSLKGKSNYVWALKNINIDINRGEVVGIIGKNGAGKSTLLKILSKVTKPTTGKIKSNGRIASLLEVGTGFHGEMTGLENIYLNGAILGMTKGEIKSKLDEIISFSGCERYIDTPIKRYSNGMTVRLAFAVAAHLEPDILIIDEVLAVGDLEFQKKAIGKIKDISNSDGRTVLFVSHNMASVKNLCTRGLVLENGCVSFQGSTKESVDYYLKLNQHQGYKSSYINESIKGSGILRLSIVDEFKILKSEFEFDQIINIIVIIKIQKIYLQSFLGFKVIDKDERIIFTSQLKLTTLINSEGVYEFEVKFPKKFLVPGQYQITLGLHIPNIMLIDYLEECLSFEILETGSDFYLYNGLDFGCVFADCRWDLIN